jgi:DNA polymerase III alpha subunit
MGGCRTAYKLAKKNGLVSVLGMEGYLRPDVEDPIAKKFGIEMIEGSYEESLYKYAHMTIAFRDEAAYYANSKIVSKRYETSEKHGQEYKPLYTWSDMEELSNYNITLGSGCLIGWVQRCILQHGNFDLARAYYEKIRALSPGNFFVELFPHVCDRNWDSAVFLTLLDGTELRFPLWKKLLTDLSEDGKGHKAEDLARKKIIGDHTLTAVMENRKMVEREPVVFTKIEKREGFIMNECRPWCPDSDVQLACNRFLLQLAKEYGDPVLVSDDSHLAYPEDKVVQDIKLQASGGNWRFSTSYHRQTSDEAFEYFKNKLNINEAEFEKWIENSYAWKENFKDFKFNDRLHLPNNFYPTATLPHVKKLIEKHGRMEWNNPIWRTRLSKEIKLLAQNGKADFLPYFFMIEEGLRVVEENGDLPGPGRGSAAGLLLSYTLGITHVDPMRYGLSEDRFMTPDRIEQGKLPDIDIDLPSKDVLTDPENGWLKRRFGDCVAQIATINTLKLRNAAKDVARVRHGEVPKDVENLTANFKNAPQGITDKQFVFGYLDDAGHAVPGTIESDQSLIEYTQKYPNDWDVVVRCLGNSRGYGRHASAFVVGDIPVQEYIPTMIVGDVRTTQYTAQSCEDAGAIKMDFLGLNTLKDISRCLQILHEQTPVPTEGMTLNGRFVPALRLIKHQGQFYDIWDLPEDQAVFNEVSNGNNASVFQFDTHGVTNWLKAFNHEVAPGKKIINSIRTMADFTALDRKGPLDAIVPGTKHNVLIEYALRAQGKGQGQRLEVLDRLLPDTYGLIIYQEQLTKVYKEVGNTTGVQAEAFRVHTGKKQMEEMANDRTIFMLGAINTLGEKQAEELWNMMVTFAQYGFNLSHAICYTVIAYASAFLKYHFPLTWWCGLLRNADKKEIDTKFWRYCGNLIDNPDINESEDEFEIKNGKIRAPINLLMGIGPKAHEELCANRPYASLEDYCLKIEQHKTKNAVTLPDGRTRKGSSQLNIKINSNMIIAGAMDSLFPPGMTTIEKLMTFNDIQAKVMGKKKPELVDPKYANITPVGMYQVKRKILQAYTEDMKNLYADSGINGVYKIGDKWRYMYKGQKISFLGGHQLEILSGPDAPPIGKLTIAVPAFIIKEEMRSFHGNKQMQKAQVDVDGSRFEYVRWPGHGRDKLPVDAIRGAEGALVILILEKYKPEKPFAIKDVIMVSEAID